MVPVDSSFMDFSVGQHVRVFSFNRDSSKIALVAVKNDLLSYDVIYLVKTAVEEEAEEENVDASRFFSLREFEERFIKSSDLLSGSSAEMKECGNYLFATAKDCELASFYYEKALVQLLLEGGCHKISVGANVLVSIPGAIDYASGMVYDLIEGSSSKAGNIYEIMYDDPAMEAQAQQLHGGGGDASSSASSFSMGADRLVLLSSSDAASRELQRSIYMNMARCAMKKRHFGWSVRFCSISLAIIQVMTSEKLLGVVVTAASPKKALCDALFLRGKSLLSLARPGFARCDSTRLRALALEGGGGGGVQDDAGAKSTQLNKEIDAFVAKRKKTNRQLAVNVSAWVEKSMELSVKFRGGGGGEEIDADVDIPGDAEGENGKEEVNDDEEERFGEDDKGGTCSNDEKKEDCLVS